MDDEISSLNSIKQFNSNLNFVYEELIRQFLNKNGNCEQLTFCLINWSYVLDSSRNRGKSKNLNILIIQFQK